MRNLKKLLAVIVTIAMVATFAIPAFAADEYKYSTEATKLNTLGLYLGTGNPGGEFVANLGATLTREAGIGLVVRLMGKDAEAKAMSEADITAALKDATDLSKVSSWAKPYLAYAVKNGWYLGTSTSALTLDPQGSLLGKMLASYILRAMGYSKDETDISKSIALLQEKGGISADQATAMAEKSFLRDDAVGMMFAALQAKYADNTTVITKLVSTKAVDEAKAIAAGVYTSATPLDISSAVALNSKVVELTLATAAKSQDLTGVTVKDSAAKDVTVSKIEFAPWSTDGKDVLVTLGADTAVGTYYTVTSGTKSANFGGKAVDTTAPTVTKVETTDYNQITVTFSEPILLGGAVTAAMKYTPKTALATSTIAYASSSSITVTTDAQSAVLYGTVINGFKDLAGTAMTEDTAKTFIGQTKSTTVPAIASISVVDSLSVKVVFNEKMDDVTAVDLSKYTAALKYTPKTALTIASVTKDANDSTGKTVILTFANDTVASLYEVTVAAGVTSKYGVASTAASSLTFIGVVKDTTALTTPTVTTVSNTQLTLDFGDAIADKVDPATTKDMFSIKMKYAPYTELAISSISIADEVVTINTAAQGSALYEITIKTGIKDAKGNATTAELKPTFVGRAVDPKISSIDSIINANSGTTLTLTFNYNVGAGAFDVANYFISGGIGYPSKAEAVDGANASVKLTIPATTLGTSYSITVKNVKNADGIAMDAAGISKTFIGTGAAAGLAQMIAVQTLDEQTIKVYFDRDVTDAKVAGVIWDSTLKSIINSRLTIDVAAAGDFALTSGNTYAYQDLNDKTALVIRVNQAGIFNATNKDATVGAFKLKALAGANLNADNDELIFVPSETDMAGINIVNVQAIDNQTIKVYFDQPTYIDNANFAKITSTVVATGLPAADITLSNPVVVAGSNNMAYTLKLSAAMANTSKNFTLTISDTKTNLLSKINDTSTALNFVTLADEDGTTGDPVAVSRLFAPNFTAAADVTDIAVQMTDEKTLVVYYPEAMDISGVAATDGAASASVLDFDNYVINNGSAAPVTMSDDTPFNNTTDIGNITWDATNNTATITLNKSIKTAAGGAFLYFNTAIANVNGLANVIADTAQVYKQFALNAADAAEVGISSVTVDGANITIVLDQKSTISGANVTLNGTKFLENFSITKLVGGVDVPVVAADILKVVASGNDTLTVTLTSAIPANTGVTVKGILTNVANIVGMYNAEGLNDASEVVVAANAITATLDPIALAAITFPGVDVQLTGFTAAGGETIAFTSSNTAVATVNATGLVHPLSVGTTTISYVRYTTATGVVTNYGSLTVTVTAP